MLNCTAVNPLTGEEIPIFLKSDENFGEKSLDNVPFLDAKLGMPSLDLNAKEFASDHNLKYREIIDDEKLINSNEVNNKRMNFFFKKMMKNDHNFKSLFSCLI